MSTSPSARAACSAAREAPLALAWPRHRGPFAALALPAVLALAAAWRRGFPDAAHELPFPRAQGFTSARELHRGDVFPRALIADALADADALAPGQLAPLVAAEAEYLLAARRTDGVGGWSYFPTLPELPPDADDLAQVMQVFLHAGRRDWIAAWCEPPLAVLLGHGRLPGGGWETWIVPAAGRSAVQDLQAGWAARAWGTGADPEVVANLLHALALYDRARFGPELAAGRRWLAGVQQPDGSWGSGWYEGPFYGTYVAHRALAASGGGEAGGAVARNRSGAAVNRGLDFLRRSQRGDGGWGAGEGDPLSTALALLGLAAGVGTAVPAADLERARAAAGWLAARRPATGPWPAVPLIRMELGRAVGRIHQVLTYGSPSVTTAFVLKAAASWHGLDRGDTT